MDIIGSILAAIFIALLIAGALTFGFTLLLIIVVVSGALAVLTILHDLWRRWRFVSHAEKDHRQGPTVIDGEYEDITKDK